VPRHSTRRGPGSRYAREGGCHLGAPVSGLFLTLIAGVFAFASTNVDDLLVLVAFFADRTYGTRFIVIGQLAGQAVLIAIALVASRLVATIEPARVGLLGLVPIILGVIRLAQLRRAVPELEEDVEAEARRFGRAAAVALVTVANGADNLAAWVPFFGAHDSRADAALAALFVLLTAAWIVVARAMVNHPRGEALVRRYGRDALPWVLILLGAYILLRTGAVAPF